MEKDKVKTLCIGTTLQNGKYTIVKELGHGSFGITYQATTDVALNGKLGNMNVKVNVAIKEFFMPDLNNRAVDGSTVEGTKNTLVVDYRRKFRREAENLARLHHAGIVKVLEIFDENNTTYYVMEYIEGENLDKYIMRRGHLDENETKVVVCEIASALEYMHKYRMLHLDLKPKNIMHDSNGRVKLIDFGLSKQYTAEGEPESSTSIGMGTLGYAPIEQANYHQDGTFPVTLDIYAFGATIYKMLTGQTPPHASDLLEDGFPETMFRNLGVSEHMIGCVKKAMGPTKKSRYQTVDGMVRDIERDDVSSGEIPTVNDGTEDDEMTYIHEDRQHNAVEDEQINKDETEDVHHSYDETMSRSKKVFLVFLLLVLCGVGIWLLYGNNKKENTKPDYIADSGEAISSDDYVDLGLPSGTLWASCNVGASAPYEKGGIYAWGETVQKQSYRMENYFDIDSLAGSSSLYDMFGTEGQTQQSIIGTKYDVASAVCGPDYVMPTKAQLDELNTECTWTWGTLKRVKGMIVTGPNGNSIFLPACGSGNENGIFGYNEDGDYWCGELCDPKVHEHSNMDQELLELEGPSARAYSLEFMETAGWIGVDENHMVSCGQRYYGCSVRPVYVKN